MKKYVVIFRAKIASLDDEYSNLANQLRNKAFQQYNCIDFYSYNENGNEIAISYWKSLTDISAWKNDPEHKLAQEKGKEKWYSNYEVEIAELIQK